MSDQPIYEVQLAAMRTIMEALKPLDDDAKESVLSWIDGQIGRKARKTADHGTTAQTPQAARRDGTVSVVAQKIGAKSARDLVLAAAGHLTLFQGKDSFTKEDLVACAKDARNWKSNYSNQMAINIKRMMEAGTLFEKSKNVFSLSDAALAEIEGKLSDGK